MQEAQAIPDNSDQHYHCGDGWYMRLPRRIWANLNLVNPPLVNAYVKATQLLFLA
ncbi:protein of unknown function [Shewanella benthica]|uniref:Uncharacterized protein n=1 Tax=Shewanella benthica TaxID=43661 RepID=A0A330M2G8_9GAMM|nr:protein of unknown function [Shewanella benthica]